MLSKALWGGGACVYPPMAADLIEVPTSCGLLDPTPHLGPEGAAILANPDLLFPEGLGDVPTSLELQQGSRAEYVKVIIKQLRGNKLVLLRGAKGAGKVFCVGKRGTHKLREVWHGGALTRQAARAPKPPLQASPAALANLECSVDRPIWVSGRDAASFFDQLRLPPHLTPYMGRPDVSLGELVSHDLDPEYRMSSAELGLACDFDSRDDMSLRVTPCSKVWPMGFGWSSYVAQSFMLGSVRGAGFGDHQLLAEEWCLPPLHEPAITIATDDVLLMQRGSSEEIAAASVSPLHDLDCTWTETGVTCQAAKSFDSQLSCNMLGVSLRDGVALAPRSDRLALLPDAASDLFTRKKCTPRQLSSFIWSLQWWNLLNRPLFSCLSAAYAFCRLDDESSTFALGPLILSELALNISLLGLWVVDLTAGWMNVLGATDASPSFGYGMSLAPISPLDLRALAAHAFGCDCIFRPAVSSAEQALEKPRKGRLMRLPFRARRFKQIFSIRARTVSHSGGMEADAAALGLARLARNRRLHSSRGLLLVDAKVVESSLRKGRSSAPTLRRPIAKAAGIQLAAGFRMRYGYIPSESNPSDRGSRGLKPVGRVRKSHLRRPASPSEAKLWRLRVQRSAVFCDGPPFGSSVVGHASSGGSSDADDFCHLSSDSDSSSGGDPLAL